MFNKIRDLNTYVTTTVMLFFDSGNTGFVLLAPNYNVVHRFIGCEEDYDDSLLTV